MFAIMLQAQPESGLTLREVLHDLPHDAGAVLIYVLFAAFLVLIWLGSRTSGKRQT